MPPRGMNRSLEMLSHNCMAGDFEATSYAAHLNMRTLELTT